MATNPREVTRQRGNNDDGYDVPPSMLAQDTSDQFFLDPKVIYEQREKLTEKEARGEDSVSSKPGAYSSLGSGGRSQNASSNHSPSKAASHGTSPSRPDAPNKNGWQLPQDRYALSSSDEDDDEFAGYVNPQDIQDQREKLAAKEEQHPPGNVRQLPHVGAVPSSSSSKNTVKTDSTATTTGSSSYTKGSKKSKSKSKNSRREKQSRRHRNTGTSDRQEQPRDQMPVQTSPAVLNDNGDPVIIATATRDSAYEPRNPSKRWIVCVVISALAIGVGIGVLFGTLGKSSPSGTQVPNESPTMSPVANTSTPSPTSTLVISPSEEDCTAIAAGQSVRKQDELSRKRFTMEIKVIYQGEIFTEEFDPEDWIQMSVLPALAGCEMQKPSVRALRSLQPTDPTLQIRAAQALIGNAKLLELFRTRGCQSDSSAHECGIMELSIDLFVEDPDSPILDFQALISYTFKNDQVVDLPAKIKSMEVLKFLPPEDEETSVPVPTMPPSQVAVPQPTTSPTLPQSTESPSKAMIGPTSTPPFSAPTESPVQACDDILVDYFGDESWMEAVDLSFVEGNFLELECGEELPLIFLDVGEAGDDTCSVLKCIDALPYQEFAERCLAVDEGEDGAIWFELHGDWDDRNIVYGYENVDVENPCEGISNLGRVTLEEER